MRQRHQLGVADETNEGAHDERLQRRVVVDLGDDDAPDSGDDARPRARGLVRVQRRQDAPVALVAVDAVEPREALRIRCRDGREPAHRAPCGRIRHARREHGELGRADAGRGELADRPPRRAREPGSLVDARVADDLRERIVHRERRERLADDQRRAGDLAVECVDQLGKRRQAMAERDVAVARARAQHRRDFQRRRIDREDGRRAHRCPKRKGPGGEPGPSMTESG